MKIFYDLDVLTTNTQSNPAEAKFKIDKGLITEAGVFYPAGCHNKVYAKIFFQAHQILPRNQEFWCHGNNGWWKGALYFPVEDTPLEIKVIAYADDCDYDHHLTIAVELSPFSSIPAWDKMIWFFEKIAKVLGIRVD